MQEWLQGTLGVDPCALYPSVRCGLEAALLTTLAHSRGQSLAEVLGRECAGQALPPVSQPGAAIAVNGLLGGEGSPAEVAAQAVILAQRGFTTIKIKVRPVP